MVTHLYIWRRGKGWTQLQAAQYLGLSRSEFQWLESGRMAPTPQQRALLRARFGSKSDAMLRPVKEIA
jgi:transcriptional regulator with XRE-family HTH domain